MSGIDVTRVSTVGVGPAPQSLGCLGEAPMGILGGGLGSSRCMPVTPQEAQWRGRKRLGCVGTAGGSGDPQSFRHLWDIQEVM